MVTLQFRLLLLILNTTGGLNPVGPYLSRSSIVISRCYQLRVISYRLQIRARKFGTKSWNFLLLRESPHTINVRDGDADVIRVLFKHINLEHTGFLNNVCCFICIWIGICHQFQQDLLTKVEREI